MKDQSGLEKWEILKFPLFHIFHIFGCHRQTERPKRLIFGIWDPLDGSSQWCEWQFPHSKKILWFCFKGVPEVRGCPENTCPKKIFFFQKILLSMMPQHISRWIWVVSFSFLLYDKKREKCQFSDFVILTKKLEPMFSVNFFIGIYKKFWAFWALEFLKYLKKWLIYKLGKWGAVKNQ